MRDARLKRIYEMIDALGVRIEYCELPEDIDGPYLDEEKLIVSSSTCQLAYTGRRSRTSAVTQSG